MKKTNMFRLFIIVLIVSILSDFSLSVKAADRTWWNHLNYVAFYTDDNAYTAYASIDSISVDEWGLYLFKSGSLFGAVLVSPEAFEVDYHSANFVTSNSGSGVSSTAYSAGLHYIILMAAASDRIEKSYTPFPLFYGDNKALLNAINKDLFDSFENFDYAQEPEEDYSPDLGYLTGMDKKISIVSYLEGQNGSYVDVSNSQEIRFSWSPNTSSGVSLIRNDYQDLKIRITPKAKVSFLDIRGMSMGTFDTAFDPVEVSPSKLSYQWESSALLDYVDSVQPSSASRADVVLFFELQPVAYEFGSVSVGDVSLISLTYPNSFWGSKAKMLLTGQGVTSPFGAGISKDITIEVYDNRTEYNPDRPNIEKPGFSFDLDDFDLSDFTSTISSLLDYVLVIPQVVASILSFLPVWVTSLISLSFSLLPVLLVYKLIRG